MQLVGVAKDGFLNVRKPQGVSSHKCVQVVRKIFQTRQVGHGGTLDPMATGVLTMALGKATRFLQYLTSDKEYKGVIRFGVTTNSDDITGNILSERAAPWLTEHQVRTSQPARVVPVTADILGTSIKYRRADIELQKFIPGSFPEADIRVVCGAGTYIRSIARECGEALTIPPEYLNSVDDAEQNSRGEFCVGGTLASLERTRSGIFTLESSFAFEEIRDQLAVGQNPLVSIESAMAHLPSVHLSPKGTHRWLIGGISWIKSSDVVSATGQGYELTDGEIIRIYNSESEFLGVSQVEKQQNNDGFVLRARRFV
ncbi:tRNA uridine synthase, partial [Globisporangium splendens]